MKRWQWVGLIALTILITRSTTFLIPLIDDEETFAVIGRIILHGGLPYADVIDNKPPLLYYFYALWFWIFGEANTAALHAVGVVWVALTCYLIFKIAERAATTRAGYFAALNYAIFTTTFVPSYIALHATFIMALPLCLSVWALIRWHDTNRPRWMILAGACCGVAIFFKFQALVQVAFIFWAVGYLYFRRLNRMWDSLLPGIIGFVMGAATVIAVVLGFLHHHHILQEFVNVTWNASMTYMKEGESVGHYWRRFATHAGGYIAATFPLWIALGAHVFRRFSKPMPIWIWGWFLFSIPAVLAGGRFYGHYFIQLLPPLCIIAGVTWDAWWSRGRRYRIFIAASLVILAAGWMAPRLWFQEFAEQFNIQNTHVEQKIGNYLKTHSPKDSTLFVWGVDPSIYFFADRAPATRLLWSDGLVGRLPGVVETQTGRQDTSPYINPQNWQQFLDDLNAHPPFYIVDCASGNLRDYGKFPIRHYPLFYKFVTDHYHPETTIDGVTLFRLKR